MLKNRFFPFNYKEKFYYYDTDLGIVFHSNENINVILNKINNNANEKEILNEYSSNDDLKNIFKFAQNNKIPNENIIDIIRTKSCNSEKMWRDGKLLNKLWLSISHTCNLNCEYCFADGGSYGSKMIMSKEKAKECIDYFFKYFNKNSKVIHINFFGGEPLLNKDVFIFATNYINSKIADLSCKPKYIITTNCTNIDDEILDTIIKNNMHMNISIDGMEYIQNKNRKFVDGRGSFNIVVENIKKILKFYDNITARVTLTKSGVNTLKEDVMFLWRLGIPYVYIAPVDSENINLALDLYDLHKVDDILEELLDIMIDENLKKNFKMISNIEGYYENIDQKMILTECKYYNPFTIMFSPEGDIYKCDRTIGNKEYKVGNIYTDIEWSRFKKEYKLDEKCINCWAKRLCGGGCGIKNTEVACKFKKIILEKSLKYYSYIQSSMKECELEANI